MIPPIVYDIADGFSDEKSRTARSIYNAMSNKVHFTALRDTVLPKLVEAGVISCRVAGEGTDHESKLYTWISLANVDHKILESIASGGVNYESAPDQLFQKKGGDKPTK